MSESVIRRFFRAQGGKGGDAFTRGDNRIDAR
jgi:hypothetical protein